MTQPRSLHSVSVAAAVVDDNGLVLAIRRSDNGRWEPPGGVLEIHETITGGLIREVQEETGFVVEPLQLTGVYKNLSRGVVALVFRCELRGGLARIRTPETTDLAWLTPEQIIEMMDEAYAVRLLDALANRAPQVRDHDGASLVARNGLPDDAIG